jgi:hypothetical protein
VGFTPNSQVLFTGGSVSLSDSAWLSRLGPFVLNSTQATSGPVWRDVTVPRPIEVAGCSWSLPMVLCLAEAHAARIPGAGFSLSLNSAIGAALWTWPNDVCFDGFAQASNGWVALSRLGLTAWCAERARRDERQVIGSLDPIARAQSKSSVHSVLDWILFVTREGYDDTRERQTSLYGEGAALSPSARRVYSRRRDHRTLFQILTTARVIAGICTVEDADGVATLSAAELASAPLDNEASSPSWFTHPSGTFEPMTNWLMGRAVHHKFARPGGATSFVLDLVAAGASFGAGDARCRSCGMDPADVDTALSDSGIWDLSYLTSSVLVRELQCWTSDWECKLSARDIHLALRGLVLNGPFSERQAASYKSFPAGEDPGRVRLAMPSTLASLSKEDAAMIGSLVDMIHHEQPASTSSERRSRVKHAAPRKPCVKPAPPAATLRTRGATSLPAHVAFVSEERETDDQLEAPVPLSLSHVERAPLPELAEGCPRLSRRGYMDPSRFEGGAFRLPEVQQSFTSPQKQPHRLPLSDSLESDGSVLDDYDSDIGADTDSDSMPKPVVEDDGLPRQYYSLPHMSPAPDDSRTIPSFASERRPLDPLGIEACLGMVFVPSAVAFGLELPARIVLRHDAEFRRRHEGMRLGEGSVITQAVEQSISRRYSARGTGLLTLMQTSAPRQWAALARLRMKEWGVFRKDHPDEYRGALSGMTEASVAQCCSALTERVWDEFVASQVILTDGTSAGRAASWKARSPLVLWRRAVEQSSPEGVAGLDEGTARQIAIQNSEADSLLRSSSLVSKPVASSGAGGLRFRSGTRSVRASLEGLPEPSLRRLREWASKTHRKGRIGSLFPRGWHAMCRASVLIRERLCVVAACLAQLRWRLVNQALDLDNRQESVRLVLPSHLLEQSCLDEELSGMGQADEIPDLLLQASTRPYRGGKWGTPPRPLDVEEEEVVFRDGSSKPLPEKRCRIPTVVEEDVDEDDFDPDLELPIPHAIG